MKKKTALFLALLLTVVTPAIRFALPAKAEDAIRITGYSNPAYDDWSSAWGLPEGTGFQFLIHFNELLANLPVEEYGKYITLNGVTLADRADLSKREELGIAEIREGLWNSRGAFLATDGTSMNMVLLGGGQGNFDPAKENQLTFAADFPLKEGTLGREITMVFDPKKGQWKDANALDPVEITIGSPGQPFNDWSSAWGLDPGKGFQFVMNFSVLLGDFDVHEHGKHITFNGVTLADRADLSKREELGIDELREGLWNSRGAHLWSDGYTANLVLLGGGQGNFDPSIENVVVFSASLPLKDRVLGEDVTLIFKPDKGEWINPNAGSDVVYVNAGPAPGTPDIGYNDWSEAYGLPAGTGLEITLTFSEPVKYGLAMYTMVQDLYAEYITINGVNLKDRMDPAKKAELGIADVPENLWGGIPLVMSYINEYEIHIYLLGGGTGNLDRTKENTIEISEFLPMEGRTLDRNVVLKFDPETGVWTDLSLDEEPFEPGPIEREEAPKLSVRVDAPDESPTKGIYDRSEEFGLAPGSVMEIRLTFSGDVTDAPFDSDLTKDFAGFITINGVGLDRRADFDPALGMDTLPDEVLGGMNVRIANRFEGAETTQLSVMLMGGGEGMLSFDKKNTLVVSEELPLPKGWTLGKSFTFEYNPKTGEWTAAGNKGGKEVDDVKTGHPETVVAVFALAAFAAVLVLTARKKKALAR